MEEQLPKAVVQSRYERLVDLVNDITWSENQKLVGRTVDVLVSEGEGRKDAATHRLTGRAPDNRLVHFTPPADVDVRPGDVVSVPITYAAPHHLMSEAQVSASAVRRTRAGDAWEARTAPAPTSGAAMLGMPTVGVPDPLPASSACR
jgi:tRNA-2-methylthio-N6-dimethylallyladenosine synthase